MLRLFVHPMERIKQRVNFSFVYNSNNSRAHTGPCVTTIMRFSRLAATSLHFFPVGEPPDIITVHAEACRHLDRTVEAIREKGVLAGVALNPATPLETVRYILPKVDMLLIMTVNPGFGGQKLIPYTLDKVREAKNLVKQSGCKTDIEVDGGINLENVEEAMDAGANIIVAGSAVFKGEIEKNVEAFLEKLQRQG